MAALPPRRDQVFISYARNDAKWLGLLTKHLKPYIRISQMNVWDDRKIQAGDDWRVKIQEVLECAGVAVLLVTPDFLASDFIISNELPRFLEKAYDGGLKILWIAVKASAVTETPIIRYQALNEPKRPLIKIHYATRDLELNRMSKIIRDTWLLQCSSETKKEEEPSIPQRVRVSEASIQSDNRDINSPRLARPGFGGLTDKELSGNAIEMARGLRNLLAIHNRDMAELYNNRYVSYASVPDDITEHMLNQYDQMKTHAMMLRDELEKRLPNIDTTNWKTCDYRYPRDESGLEAVAENLERLALSINI